MKNTLSQILLASTLGFAGCATPVARVANTERVMPGKTENYNSKPSTFDILSIPQKGDYIVTQVPQGYHTESNGNKLNNALGYVLINYNSGKIDNDSLVKPQEVYAIVPVLKENGNLVLDNSTNAVSRIELIVGKAPLETKNDSTGRYSGSVNIAGKNYGFETVQIGNNSFTPYSLNTPAIGNDLDVLLLKAGANYRDSLDLSNKTRTTLANGAGYVLVQARILQTPKPAPKPQPVKEAPKPTLPSATLN